MWIDIYSGPERLSKRYSEALCATSNAKDVTYSDIHGLIMRVQEETDGQFVVVKDMAQCKLGQSSRIFTYKDLLVKDIVRPEHVSASPRVNPTVMSGKLSDLLVLATHFSDPSTCLDADLKKFRHTFLMRDPRKTIPSYYRATIGDCGDFGDFDPNEAGFAELQTLMASTIWSEAQTVSLRTLFNCLPGLRNIRSVFSRTILWYSSTRPISSQIPKVLSVLSAEAWGFRSSGPCLAGRGNELPASTNGRAL